MSTTDGPSNLHKFQLYIFSHIFILFLDFGHLREQKRFIQNGKEYKYNIYEADNPPSILFGTIGDICIHQRKIWFRCHEKWELASTELDKLDRPRQCHPLFLSKRRLDGTEWKAQTFWNNKKRKLDNGNWNQNFQILIDTMK